MVRRTAHAQEEIYDKPGELPLRKVDILLVGRTANAQEEKTDWLGELLMRKKRLLIGQETIGT